MDIQTFLLERNQSAFENEVEINLTESGVHPLAINDLFTPTEVDALLSLPIGYGHTEGTPQLRSAIASWYPGADAENVLVTTGGSEANFLIAWALLDARADMGLMVPNFMQLDGIGKAFANRVHPIRLQPERDWRIDFDKLESRLKQGLKLVSIVNPHNPTGTIMRADDMRRLVALVEQYDTYLLVDEIYRGAELEGHAETPSFWGMSERVMVTSSTSKSVAHAGLRIGWMVAPPAIVRQCMRRQDYTTIGTSPLSQYIACRLLQPQKRAEILARTRSILTTNLHLAETWITAKDRGLDFIRPQAGGMIFVKYRHALNSSELSRRLRDSQSVFIVAGDWFGMDGYLRIGIGGEKEKLRQGLSRLGQFLDQL